MAESVVPESAVGVKIAVKVVVLTVVNALNAPAADTKSPIANPVGAWLNVAVIVAVSPTFTAVTLLVNVTVGALATISPTSTVASATPVNWITSV